MNKHIPTILISLCVVLVVTIFNEVLVSSRARIAYVDSNKLLTGFSEANAANKELEKEQKEYEKNLKALQDSLQAQMDLMSKGFDAASDAKKNVLRTKLEKANEDMNRYHQYGQQEMTKRHQERMGKILQKVNSYVAEYSKDKGYDLVLGSTNNGNILYGSESRFDITNDLVKGLNKRYK